MSKESEYQVRLPEQPIDGYEVQYFSIREQSVQQITLKYHVNSKWDDVCKDRGGVDFVDQWQVFTDGHFSGRMEGWLTPSTRNHVDHFESRLDAVIALKQHFTNRAKSHEERAAEYRRKAREVK